MPAAWELLLVRRPGEPPGADTGLDGAYPRIGGRSSTPGIGPVQPRGRSRSRDRRLGAVSSSSNAKGILMSKPTIVLVHGAFGDASSWRGVFDLLEGGEYTLLAAALPLRGV